MTEVTGLPAVHSARGEGSAGGSEGYCGSVGCVVVCMGVYLCVCVCVCVCVCACEHDSVHTYSM